LVSSETILMEDLRQSKCYYIDYQMFVDMVRYRIYLMDKAVNSSENDEINETKYKCPTCAKEILALEAQKCRSKDFKFICTSCCPHSNFRELVSEPAYRLIPLDVSNKVRNAKAVKTKLLKALQACPEHDGLYDLLRDLKDAAIKRNLPSENMSRGFKTSEVLDEDKKQAILDNLGRPVLSKKNRYLVSDHVVQKEGGVSVSIEDTDNSVIVTSGVHVSASALIEGDQALKRMRPESRVPEFLNRSGVHGANALYQMEGLQAPGAAEAAAAATAAAAAQQDEDAMEDGGDIAWEDAEDEDD
jgi:predicted RNA-binding Zn-ribbon protein involved in translation (DUF1610 family)